MKKNGLFAMLIAIMMITTLVPLMVDAGTSSSNMEESREDSGEIETEMEEDSILTPAGSENDFIDINEMIDSGIGTYRTVDIGEGGISASLYDLSWIKENGMRALADAPMADNETDAIDAPFFAYDEDDISNNVTSTISGNQITFDDEDYYQINLTSDGVNSTVEKLELTVTSTEAVDRNASLTVEVLQVDFLLGQWMDAGFESVGKFHGSSKKIVVVPEGDVSLNLEIPIMFRFRSWNNTMLNFSFEVDITSTTRTEWNGLLGAGPVYNSTNKPARMQSINRSHDLFDWFDLTGAIDDINLNTNRGDEIRFGVSIDVATEERGTMYNPYGLYGTQSPTSSIMFIYLVWVNYTSQQLNIYNTQGNLPFASVLFQNDPQTLVFRSQADHAWLGMAPLALWGDPNGQYAPGAEGNAEMFFNITSISANLIPPNKAPVFSLPIEDQDFAEDEGPWNVTDLLTHFTDEDTITPLEFKVTKPSGVENPDEIEVTVKDGRYLWINVTEEHWFGEGEYRIRCYDYGVLDPTISVDDREAVSNDFEVVINPVNDPAYIEKVDGVTGTIDNEHDLITITIRQGSNQYRSKKVYGRDYDTEDQGRLVYSHNATTNAFSMNKNGQIDFIPTNEEVGATYVRIWVDDQKGRDEDDYLDLKFNVTNRNDPPELREIEWIIKGTTFDITTEDNPTFRNVKEGSEINLTVTAHDPDIVIGQPDELTWSVGAQGWNVYPHPTDPLKAYVTYTPTNDDSIATTVETNIFCMDTANAMSQDDIMIRLTIENRNDPPEILTVNDEVPVEEGASKKIFLTQETGKYALEDQLFYIYVVAEDIDPRDTVEFTARDASGLPDTSFQFFPDPLDEFAGNFTLRPTQEMVGFHTVVITVSDEEDETDSVIVQYEVVNTNDPPGDFKADWETGAELIVGKNITFFVDDLTDPDGDELTVTWDFGDNTGKVTGETVTHSFANDQSYIITVTVTDPSGEKSELTRTITIYPEEEEEPDPDLDTDGDGMPDVYEDNNGLNKNNLNDATMDEDRDGFTNIEEYRQETNPIDPKSHPPKEESDDGGSDLILYLVVIIVVVLVLVAIGFFAFVLLRKPKPVVQQQAYAPESGLPGGSQQGLPGQAPQQLPPGSDQQSVGSGQEAQGLPPAPEPEPEEELPDSFLESAAEALKEEEPSESDAEQNIWRPPAQEAEPVQESQVDDLFAEPPGEEAPEGPSQPEEEPEEEAPTPSEKTGLPPPPPAP